MRRAKRKKEESTFIRNHEGGYLMSCRGCGEKEKITPPMPVEVLIKWMEVFIKRHKDCEVKPE